MCFRGDCWSFHGDDFEGKIGIAGIMFDIQCGQSFIKAFEMRGGGNFLCV